MRITVIGTGYVGLVAGTCFAEGGNDVVCIDIDEEKIENLRRGIVPIYEPGLEELLKRNVHDGRLSFTTSYEKGMQRAQVAFIAVGTPSGEDGSADLTHVMSAARSIAQHMTGYLVVVDKSTVPVGTAKKVHEVLKNHASHDFDVVSNPEFLKEGAALDDFMKPDRVVVGSDNENARDVMHRLYEPFVHDNPNKIIHMDVRSAEVTKYAANAMLATRISFMNEIANICERVGADVTRVRSGIGTDGRIGMPFLYAGCGYGGSCFPKDVKAVIRTAKDHGYDFRILESVEEVNERQKHVLFNRVVEEFGTDLAGRRFAVWGLAFKPNTDDMREAPSRVLMESLWDAGASVRAYDPEATAETKRLYPDQEGLELCESAYDALDGTDALAIMTEWQEFRSPDLERVRDALSNPVIFDGRNLYEPELLRSFGLSYYAIGRGDNVADTTPAHRRRKTDDVRSASS